MSLLTHSKRKGTAGEVSVLKYLTHNDYPVFTEFGDNSRIDLAVEVKGVLLRIQVKYAEKKNGCYTLCSKKDGPNYSYVYSKKDVDLFALYCAEDDVVAWMAADEFLSDDDVARTVVLRAASELPKNNQTKHIRWLKDYLSFEDCLDKLIIQGPVTRLKASARKAIDKIPLSPSALAGAKRRAAKAVLLANLPHPPKHVKVSHEQNHE